MPAAFRVFEWFAWDRFLITHILPNARRIPVLPGFNLSDLDTCAAPAMVHVNLSRPGSAFPDYVAWLARYEQAGSPVVNGYFESIDKWVIQEACKLAGLPHVRAGRHGDPEETLIIKVRANHRGRYERQLPVEITGELAPPSWPYPDRVHKLKRNEIPDNVWEDPRITVERYIGNAQGRFRRAYVAGEYVAVAMSHSPDLVKEMDHRRGVELISTPDASQRPLNERDPLSVAYQLARTMRVDFGALDLAVDDSDIVYPVDVNTTPVWRGGGEGLIHELSEAFASLIEKGSRYSFASRR